MNQAEQAQKGFKTFILTLSISLIVFSAVYYFITNSSSISSTPDIESDSKMSSQDSSEPSSVASAESVFNKLATTKTPDVQPQAVLAATSTALEPTQASGTPQGGVTSITMGLITSVAIFLFGMYVIARDPRRLAIQEFERKIRNDL
jgi:hypothetical protein